MSRCGWGEVLREPLELRMVALVFVGLGMAVLGMVGSEPPRAGVAEAPAAARAAARAACRVGRRCW